MKRPPRRLNHYPMWYGNHLAVMKAGAALPGRYPDLRAAYAAAAELERMPLAKYVRAVEAECGAELDGILTAAERAV